MNRSFNKFIFMLLGLVFSGCSSLVNPYNSDFQCPAMDKGKCISVNGAYKESIDNSVNPLVREDVPCTSCDKDKEQPSTPHEPSRQVNSEYETEKYHRLAQLIKQPTPPLVAPPQAMRVLVLSYTSSDNEMYGYRYIYFFATDPKWIFSTTPDGD